MHILNYGGDSLVDALRARGHHVVSVGVQESNDIPLRHPVLWRRLKTVLETLGFRPDCALWMDDGNLPALLGVEQMPFPSLFYSIDTFCNPWHVPFANGFDLALAAQQGHVPLFPALTDEPAWMPLFAPDGLQANPQSERDIPTAFVGTLKPRNIPQRYAFLQAFRRLHPLFFTQGAYAPVFSRARIVLNQTAAEEVNFRCFESMACGAALLTETSAHGLTTLFTPGEHILPPYTPNDASMAASIAAEWLSRPETLAELALAGCKQVRAQHLASHRAARVETLLAGLVIARAHSRRMENLESRRILLSTAYAILMDELQSDALRDHQGLYRTAFSELRF